MEEIFLSHNRRNWAAFRQIDNKMIEATPNFRYGDGSRHHLPIMKVDLNQFTIGDPRRPTDEECQVVKNYLKGIYPDARVLVVE